LVLLSNKLHYPFLAGNPEIDSTVCGLRPFGTDWHTFTGCLVETPVELVLILCLNCFGCAPLDIVLPCVECLRVELENSRIIARVKPRKSWDSEGRFFALFSIVSIHLKIVRIIN
jgi:hypothetical protein